MEQEKNIKEKLYKVQVPNELIQIKNNNHKVMFLYTMLKAMSTTDPLTRQIYVKRRYDKILETLDWETRTFKKHITLLADTGFITIDEESLKHIKSFHQLYIKVNSLQGNFTQVDINTVNSIIALGKNTPIVDTSTGEIIYKDWKEVMLRLFYFYESYYDASYGYSFPTLEQIRIGTGISRTDIVTMNKLFEKNDLVEIKHGVRYYNAELNIYLNYNNTYTPKCIR